MTQLVTSSTVGLPPLTSTLERLPLSSLLWLCIADALTIRPRYLVPESRTAKRFTEMT